MVYDICLDAASFLIMLIIILSSLKQKAEITEQNRRFYWLTGVTMVTLVFDIAGSFFIGYPEMLPVKVNMALQSAGFVMISLTVYFYTRYMEVFVPGGSRVRRARGVNMAILVLYDAFHIVNIFTGWIFYFDARQVYTRGPYYLTVYIIPFYLFLYGAVIMIGNRKYVERRQYLATMSLIPFISVGAVLQFSVLARYMVILFAVTLAEIVIFFNLETPDYRKLAETLKQLEQARQDATEAARAKSDFLARMSHEIRTPINAILGMNEMILRECSDKTILQYANNAYDSGKALLSIISDVLDISKIESGKLEIIETEYDLHSLVSDCYHMTVEQARKKGLLFTVSVEESLPSVLYGDMYHLRQVSVNFLSNAIKYTDEGAVELIFSGVRDGGVLELAISVRDTGIGLTRENMETLFNSFQRFDLKRNQSVEGSGLGLSICKQLTELMGGTVTVKSEYGQGSTFQCRVPQRIANDWPIGSVTLDDPAKYRKESRAKKYTAPDARILVVDDVAMNLVVFSGLLKPHELQIDEAESGRECLELIRKNEYDVIFMDHMMPEMDGLETFAQMGKIEHKNRNTPVIMLTANAISGEKERYLQTGFSSYLTKPIQSSKLEALLLEFLPEDKIVWENNAPGGEQPVDAGAGEFDFRAEEMDPLLLDLEVGLSYFDGDVKAYCDILSIYVEAGEDNLQRIASLMKQSAWKDYVTAVHALKSTSLTIGAKTLSEAAAELERAGKSGDYETIQDRNEALLARYRQVIAAGGRLLEQSGFHEAKPEPAEVEPIAAERLRDYGERIRRAAEGFDRDEILSLCGELSRCRYDGVELSAALQQVRAAAEDFECELAGEYAEALFVELLSSNE